MATHGLSGIPTYNSWVAMRQRCRNPNNRGWPNYGGRGIKVCDTWLKFEQFFADMGERPEGMSLDRIDNDGHYEPANCRWATAKEQRANQRDVKLTAVQVVEIRAIRERALSAQCVMRAGRRQVRPGLRIEVADWFSVSPQTISAIWAGETWR